jgi:hypothetical protein
MGIDWFPVSGDYDNGTSTTSLLLMCGNVVSQANHRNIKATTRINHNDTGLQMNQTTDKANASGAEAALAIVAATRLYEKGLRASSVVASLKKGGHSLGAVARAAHKLPTLDAMLFGESWGGDVLEQRAARCAFMDTESRSVTRAGACDEIPAESSTKESSNG